MTNPPTGSPKPYTRIQRNLLADGERKLLTWLCARMPKWVTPDLMTAVGVLGALLVCAAYAASSIDRAWLWAAIAGYGVQWFGDSMDGSLARYRQIERPSYGYFIDHSCDGLATLLILFGMGLSPYVRLDVALVALAGYLLLSIHAYLAARVVGEFRLSYLAAGPTELRLVLIALTIGMFIWGGGPNLVGPMSGFDLVVGIAGMILIALFVMQTLVTAKKLAAAERRVSA